MLLRRRIRMSGVVTHLEHFSYLDLLHIERKAVREARLRSVKRERQLVQLESAMHRVLAASLAQCLHLRQLHWLKSLRYFARLLESVGFSNAGNRTSHG